MKGLLKSLGGLVPGWWTLTGAGDDPNQESADRIPTMVREGGGGSLAIEADTSSAAQMRVSFSREGEDGQQRSLHTWEEVAAGHHAWTIDVPNGVGGYVELGAVDPRPGDELRWTLAVNGETVDEQSDTLEKPLEKGWAFALRSYFDDYASGTLGDG
jgi:hypothetical protein